MLRTIPLAWQGRHIVKQFSFVIVSRCSPLSWYDQRAGAERERSTRRGGGALAPERDRSPCRRTRGQRGPRGPRGRRPLLAVFPAGSAGRDQFQTKPLLGIESQPTHSVGIIVWPNECCWLKELTALVPPTPSFPFPQFCGTERAAKELGDQLSVGGK